MTNQTTSLPRRRFQFSLRTLLIVVTLCAILFALFAIFVFNNKFESNVMIAEWDTGIGKPCVVEGVVLRNGKPVANHTVATETTSGWLHVRTDKNGKFSENVSEVGLVALSVVDAEGGGIRWAWLLPLNISDGVRFNIELK